MVASVNDPPVLAAIGNRQADPDVLLTFSLPATDPDGPQLTYSMSGAPAGATLTGVPSARPTLLVGEASDSDGDALVYLVEVARLADPDVVVWGAYDLVPTDGTATASIDQDLVEGGDLCVAGVRLGRGGTEPRRRGAELCHRPVNEAPTALTVVAPIAGSTVASTSPTLRVGATQDPDGDALSYVFEVFESLGSSATSTSAALAPDANGHVSLALPEVLEDGAVRYWRAYAIDARGGAGPASSTASFSVDLSNLPPPPPDLVAPIDGEWVGAVPVTLVATAVTDPEGLPVTYIVDVAPTLDFFPDETTTYDDVVASGDQVEVNAGSLGEGAWAWRVRATDGATFSEAVEAGFVVDTVNDPPPAPALIAPTDNGLVSALPVELVAATVTDPEGEPLRCRFELTSAEGATVLFENAGVVDDDDGAADELVRAAFGELGSGQKERQRGRASCRRRARARSRP